MTELPSDEQAVRTAAAKRHVPEGYLLEILRLTRGVPSGRVVEQVEQIIRKEADGRASDENSSGRA
jgi:hypothetical protein